MLNKKRLLILATFLSISFHIFADGYYICLGSFHKEENARERLTLLSANYIPVFIQLFGEDQEQLYRIFLDEEFESYAAAMDRKAELNSLAVIKSLNIKDAWVLKLTRPSECTEEPPLVLENPEPNLHNLAFMGLASKFKAKETVKEDNNASTPEAAFPSLPSTHITTLPVGPIPFLVVTEADGTPLKNILVSIDDIPYSLTDQNGRFELPALSDGEHKLWLLAGPERPSLRSSIFVRNGSLVGVSTFKMKAPYDGTLPQASEPTVQEVLDYAKSRGLIPQEN